MRSQALKPSYSVMFFPAKSSINGFVSSLRQEKQNRQIMNPCDTQPWQTSLGSIFMEMSTLIFRRNCLCIFTSFIQCIADFCRGDYFALIDQVSLSFSVNRRGCQ